MPTTTESQPVSPSQQEAIDLLNAFSDALEAESTKTLEQKLAADYTAYEDSVKFLEKARTLIDPATMTADNLQRLAAAIAREADKADEGRAKHELQGEAQLLYTVSNHIDNDTNEHEDIVNRYFEAVRQSEDYWGMEGEIELTYNDFVALVKQNRDEALAYIIVNKYRTKANVQTDEPVQDEDEEDIAF